MSDVPVLDIKNVSVGYGSGRRPVVRAVNNATLALRRGEVIGLVGESGSGKSTLGLAATRLLPSDSNPRVEGQILLKGQDIAALSEKQLRAVRGRNIAMIFQDPMISLHPQLTVGKQIVEMLEAHDRARGAAADARAVELLKQVGIGAPDRVAKAYPHQLSGGMRQRVMIAIAIAAEPDVLIADEPTTALDVTVAAQIVALLLELRDRLGMAILYITHDLSLLARIADRIAVMYGGRLVETGDIATIYREPAHPYTRALLGAALRIDRPTTELKPIPGSPVNPAALPPGCAFAARCPLAEAQCLERVPELESVGAGHLAACWLARRDGQVGGNDAH